MRIAFGVLFISFTVLLTGTALYAYRAPTASFSLSPANIVAGSTVTLSFASANGSKAITSASINNGVGAVAGNTSGTRSVTPTVDTTYTFSISDGTTALNPTASVVVASCPMVVYPTSVNTGNPVELSWSSAHVTGGTIDHGIGAVGPSGSVMVYPTSTITYSGTFAAVAGLTCTGSATITVGDSVSPTVSLTAPSNGATLSGSSISLTATASDNMSVAGVRFKIDGQNIGSEITSAPYSTTWNSTAVLNGSHTLSAVARDGSNHYATSSIAITVQNSGSPTASSSIPFSTAPAANVYAPVNTGPNDQVKNGGLALTALSVVGNAYVQNLLGINNTSPMVALDVGGIQKIGDGGETCTSGIAGAIKYNKSLQVIQLCNGSSWVTLGVDAGGGAMMAVSATLASVVGIANGTWTTVSWTQEEFDDNNFHSTSVNPSRITVTQNGRYNVATAACFNTAAAGSYIIDVYKNGASLGHSTWASFGTGSGGISTQCVRLNFDTTLLANDYLEVKVYQSSGSTVNLMVLGSFFEVKWMYGT